MVKSVSCFLRFLLFGILLNTAFTAKGQDLPKVVTFDNKTNTNNTNLLDNQNLKRTVIKHDLLSFVRGDYSLFIEQRILSSLSAEIGLGFTTIDYVGSFILDYNTDVPARFRDIPLGTSFSAALRFYNHEVFDGGYFAPQVLYRTYKQRVTFMGNELMEKRKALHYRILLGYSADVLPNLNLDFGTAYGFVNHTYEGLPSNIATFPSNNNFKFHFDFQIKIGYKF